MFHSAGAQVAEQLGNVFVGKRPACLQFHNQTLLDEQVSEVLAKDGVILVVDP